MTNERIGSFIAAVRKERNMTQEQLAERLGISNRSISRWETGKTMPDIRLMEALCRVLDIRLPELLQGTREAGEMDTAQTVALMAEMAARETEQKARKLNESLLLAMLLLLTGWLCPLESLRWGASAAGFAMLAFAILRNSQVRKMTPRELAVLSRREAEVQMRTAAEMIRFARKYQKPELKQQRKAFEAIAEVLRPEEYAVFAMTGSGFRFDGNPGPWHIGLAVTDSRLLLCGEFPRGRLLTVYIPQWLERSEIKTVDFKNGKIVLHGEKNVVSIEGENLKPMAEKLKKLLEV